MNYFEAYRDVWGFHKRHSKVLNTDAYWQSVINESGQITKKYGNDRFVNDLLIAVVAELERISRRDTENAQT